MDNLNIQYNLPTDSINKINRWFTARKAAGIEVQPWELEQAYKAEFATQANKETNDMQFGLNFNENKRQFDLNQTENKRRLADYVNQANKNREMADTAGKWELGSSLLTNIIGGLKTRKGV
jgi:hypothetical protein